MDNIPSIEALFRSNDRVGGEAKLEELKKARSGAPSSYHGADLAAIFLAVLAFLTPF